jgi:hypothetical protein
MIAFRHDSVQSPSEEYYGINNSPQTRAVQKAECSTVAGAIVRIRK